jgi:hypothetical protein
VTRRPPPEPAIRDIHFGPFIARQCAREGCQVPEWLVCDTIANGTRRVVEESGAHGGKVVLFTRDYADIVLENAPPSPFRGEVTVLGELTWHCCFALMLLKPRTRRKKTGKNRDF